MSFPPTFLDELRARLTLSDVVGRKVVWDQRKSNAGKGDFWAPCPFHQEKTPSFHVDDRKGFYYCFGCQAKGDMVTFVKETENLSFIEAVERLAAEAGMEMPARRADPQAAERKDRQTRLFDVMESAVRMFGRDLKGAKGQSTRGYCRDRGLTEETLARFEIGYAPDTRTGLTEHFREKGLLDEAIAAGLVIKPEDGGAPYDRFRGRLMFPIRDGRGRCIGFGGRALSPEARAKYLNSPETEIFHKGRTLYNLAPAREAAGKTGKLIVAEGYMDVIALAQAGFDHAVAPLGTAVTEEQLQLMWRIAPEPVIALDGDTAGLRAAHKLVDLAMPHLAPGKSLGFCLMPEGQDPDDLIKAGGKRAMEAAVDAAIPMVEMLWRRALSEGSVDTPERRAALDQRLRMALGLIADQGVRNHYAAEIKSRRADLFRPASAARRGFQKGGFRRRVQAVPTPETRNSALASQGSRDVAARNREATILLIALRNPEAARKLEHEIEELPLRTGEFAAVRDGLLALLHDGTPLPPGAEEALTRSPQARAHPHAQPGEAPNQAAEALAEAIARHCSQCAYEEEVREAAREFPEADGEDWTWRLRQARLDRLRIDSEALPEERDTGEDGASAIQRMLDEEVYRRKKPPRSPSNQ